MWLVLLLCLVAVVPLSAQFIKFVTQNKTISFGIRRAPELGLMIKRIAFGQPNGPCASELVDRMIMPDFRQNRVSVIEREALNQIMAEHKFNQSSYADPTSAAQLGRILGPSALVIVNVDNCNPEQQPLFEDSKNFNGTITRTFISKTRFSLEGSIRVTDLTTGEVLQTQSFESKPEKQNSATNGQPEYPPVDEVKDIAMRGAQAQVHNMFFPWIEYKQEVFYDDKECGLKEAFELFKRGDHDGAIKMTQTNLEQCKAEHKKEKTLPRAYYDAGLATCMQGDYDKAKELFNSAMQEKGAEAVAAASADCSRAQQSAAQLKEYLARLEKVPSPQPIAPIENSPSPPTQSAPVQTTANPAGAAPAGSALAAPVAGVQPPIPKPSVEERLKKLDDLRKKGLISQKDYDTKKAEILKDL
jgi:tetratricopeptide (TPR) repeat protein